MRTTRNKNPYFYEEEEDPSLWRVDNRARKLLIWVFVLAAIAAALIKAKEIRQETLRKFPQANEVKAV